jgi:DNA-binding MarR family transcriptional regulator
LKPVASILDIARYANVSAANVLRVVNGEPVSEDIARRVQAAIDALGPPPYPRGPKEVLPALPATPHGSEASHEELLERLTQAAAALEASLPQGVGSVVYEALRVEVRPVAQHIEELDSLFEQMVSRLERLGGEVSIERRERVEDLALLTELITTGWRTVDRRLARLERMLARFERRQADDDSSARMIRFPEVRYAEPEASQPPSHPVRASSSQELAMPPHTVEGSTVDEATFSDVSAGPGVTQEALLPATLMRRLGFMLVRARAGVARLAAETLAPLDIDGRHYGVLAVLAELGPVSQQTLADILCVDRSTMVGFVDELEDRGYVRRGRNPTDRRAYAIDLTDAGRSVQREAATLLEGSERHYLDLLSPPERRQLFDLLGRLVSRDASRLPGGDRVEPATGR